MYVISKHKTVKHLCTDIGLCDLVICFLYLSTIFLSLNDCILAVVLLLLSQPILSHINPYDCDS